MIAEGVCQLRLDVAHRMAKYSRWVIGGISDVEERIQRERKMARRLQRSSTQDATGRRRVREDDGAGMEVEWGADRKSK